MIIEDMSESTKEYMNVQGNVHIGLRVCLFLNERMLRRVSIQMTDGAYERMNEYLLDEINPCTKEYAGRHTYERSPAYAFTQTLV